MIRTARQTDSKEIIEIGKECRLEEWTESDYQKEIERDGSLTFVAISNSKTIGYITARLTGSGMIKADGDSNSVSFDESDIINFGVIKKYRNRGVGKKLLKEFINQTAKIGIRAIWLEVRESNENAINFYSKNGFTKVQNRKNFYTNPVENALVMRLDLSDSEAF